MNFYTKTTKNIAIIGIGSNIEAEKNIAEVLKILAERFELSRKEIQSYLESGTVDIKLLKKQLQND